MFRFTIRDVSWLTVVAALGVGWRVEGGQYAAIQRALKEASDGKLRAETGWQHSVVEHNKTLRLIEENDLTIVGHADGTTTLEKTDRSMKAFRGIPPSSGNRP